MKLSAAIDKVIDLAKVIHSYWETELPKRHPDYPIANPAEEPVPPPPEEKKLAKLLASLPADMVYQIGLIAELGHRQFSVSDVPDLHATFKERFDGAAELARLLSGRAALADQLKDGLAELKKRNIDVDRLPLKRIKAHK